MDQSYQYKISTGMAQSLTLHHISEKEESLPFVCQDNSGDRDSMRDSTGVGLGLKEKVSKMIDNFIFRKNKSSPYFQFQLEEEGLSIVQGNWKLVCKEEIGLNGYTQVLWADQLSQALNKSGRFSRRVTITNSTSRSSISKSTSTGTLPIFLGSNLNDLDTPARKISIKPETRKLVQGVWTL